MRSLVVRLAAVTAAMVTPTSAAAALAHRGEPRAVWLMVDIDRGLVVRHEARAPA